MRRALGLALFAALTVGCAPDALDHAAPGWGESQDTAGLLGPGHDLTPWHASVRRARTTTVERDITLGDLAPDDDLVVPSELELELFTGFGITARLEETRRSSRARTWRGAVVSDPLGEVVLAVTDGRYAGTVRAHGRLFQIAERGGEQVVIERDELAIPDEAPPVPAAVPSGADPTPVGDADTVVDLMVVYTGAALAGAGGEEALSAILALAVEETNLSYAQSGVEAQVRLVHAAETSYDEANFDWSDALNRLRRTDDGFMDEVHALRDDHGADHVVLIVDTVGPYAGLGYQLIEGAVPFFDAWAFSVVARDYATGAYTFGHELGHNMGANHDHDNAGSPGYFDDSHGLQQPAQGYRTVMAYNCDSGCARINHWSNPEVDLQGVATGVSDWADNARTLGVTMPLVSGFREATVPTPTDIATITSPPDGSQLAGATVTFLWTDAGAQDYHLTLGSSPGDDSYADIDAGTANGVVAYGLPTEGETVHARLWSLTATDGWHHRDASYVAAEAKVLQGTILAPANGSSLTATALPFAWTGNAPSYRLTVGTWLDPTAFADRGAVTDHSVFVPGLPYDGTTVVARLWAAGSTQTLLDLATYEGYAAPVGSPTIQYPPPGSTLTGATVPVRWTYLAEAEMHRLTVHGALGEELAAVSTANQAVTLLDLPTDGQGLFFTLETETADGTSQTVVTYTAFGAGQ